MLQAALVIPTAKLDISHILQSSPSPPPRRPAPPPALARSISVPTTTSQLPLVSSPTSSTASHFSTATAPANFYGEQDRSTHGPHSALAPLASSAAASSKRGSPAMSHPLASPAKKQSKWSPREDMLIVQLRGEGKKWEDIAKRLPGRSSISCRLHYQNYLERKSQWDEEKKTKLARLYDRLKPEMWTNLASQLGVPWRTAEAMHWYLGEENMAHRAGTVPFVMAATSGSRSRSDVGGDPHAEPTSPGGGGRAGGLEGGPARSSDGESRGEGRRRRRWGEGGSQGTVLPSVAELEGGVGVYEEEYADEYAGEYEDEDDDDGSEGRKV